MRTLVSILRLAMAVFLPWATEARAVEGGDWVREIEAMLSRAYHLPEGDRLELLVLNEADLSGVAGGTGKLRIPAGSLPPLAPRLVLRIERITPGQAAATGVARFEARCWRSVWVATQPIPRGASLGEGVRREERDVCGLGGTLFQGDLAGGGWTAAESIRPGMPILARQVAPVALVQRGQPLQGLLQQGAMSIRLGVVALEPGVRGQSIRVRNTTSMKELKGKVIDEKTVQIDL